MRIPLAQLILVITSLFGIVLWTAGCEQSSPAEPDDKEQLPDTTAVTFSQIQSTVFNQSCAFSGCHGNGSTSGSLSLEEGEAYGNLVNVTSPNYSVVRVIPNDPDGSLLYMKITGNPQAGGRMPVGGQLSQVAIDKIKRWIENGAPND